MATAERFSIHGRYGAAGPNDGIEADSILGTIPESKLPSTSVGVSGTSFLKEASPSNDIVLTTPVSSNTGAWSQWTMIEELDPITASQAGTIIVLSNLYCYVNEVSSGGGDRLHVEGRILRIRGGDSQLLDEVESYGPRNLIAAANQTSSAFAAATKYTSKSLLKIYDTQEGDVIKVEARVVSQLTSGTRSVTYPSAKNFIQAAAWGGTGGIANPRTNQEIQNLFNSFIGSLSANQINALKTSLLDNLTTQDLETLKTNLGVQTPEEIRTLIENDLDTETVKRILGNIPDNSVAANFLKNIHINVGERLPSTTGYPIGCLFLERPTSFVYVLRPAAPIAVTGRNSLSITPQNDIYLLDTDVASGNYNSFVGRVENKNSSQLEIFLREDLLSDLNISTEENNSVKFYAQIGTSFNAFHLYEDHEQIGYPDSLPNVSWLGYSASPGTTAPLTNGSPTTIEFYRDVNKTQPINFKPATTYSSPTWIRVTGDTAPDLSHYLVQSQIESLIRSLEDDGEKILDFSFTGSAGTIDRAAVTESPALTNSFNLGDTTVVIKKIVQFTEDNAIEITTSPSVYDLQSDPKEDLINAFKEIKIKVNDLKLSFANAIAGINSAGYSWDTSANETYWQFDGKQPGTVKVGTNNIEIYEPLQRFNYVPKGSNADSGKVLKWNNTTKLPEWETEAGLDASVSEKLNNLETFQGALRNKVSLGTSAGIQVTQQNTGVNTGKKIPALRTGKADRYILAVGSDEYQFSAEQLYALPRTPIGILTTSNALQFGDTTKYWVGRTSGSIHDFLFSSDTLGTYNVTIYKYNIDLDDDARESSGTFKEHVEDYTAEILNTPSSDVSVSQDDAANTISLIIKDRVVEPGNLRSGDTTPPSNRAVVTDGTGTGFNYITPNKLLFDRAFNLFRMTDVASKTTAYTAFSPSFNISTETGHFIMDLNLVRSSGGNVGALFTEFGDSDITISGTTFSRTLVRAPVKTLSNSAGVPVIKSPIYDLNTSNALAAEYTLYFAKASDNALGYFERVVWHSGYTHTGKSFNLTRYLTLSFTAFVG